MSYWTDRLDTLLAQAAALDTVITQLQLDGTQSYTYDDGQTRVSKTSKDLPALLRIRESLDNQIAVLQVRTCGRGTYGRPAP